MTGFDRVHGQRSGHTAGALDSAFLGKRAWNLGRIQSTLVMDQ